MGGLRGARAAVSACALAVLGMAAVAHGAVMVRNGGFTNGADGVPAEWRTDAWTHDGVQFSWTPPEGQASGSAGIHNVAPNDARWCQSVAVEPGATYRVAARTRTSGVDTNAAGAHIAIEPRVADSADVRGTQDWQSLEVVARAGDESQWDVCLRLGSYANLTTGTAWFTDVAVTQVGAAPAAPSTHSLARLWEWARTSERGAALPLVGGALLAFGLGIGRRRWPS